MNDKNSLRKTLQNKRKKLNSTKQQEKSLQITKHILQSDIFIEAQKIAYYHAVNGEADPSSLNKLDANKQFFLPIISEKKQALEFAPISKNTKYQNNIFKIPEPICQPNELINAEELDLLIMPLLAFDKSGNRLGMGGGFYDRCLAYKQQKPRCKPILLGFSYNFQEVDFLIPEQWDIKLDWIATEAGLGSRMK